MSDTEEVVITRANRSQLKVNTKPEIAREKLKEKRERLKKEKENMLIEEAKKRLISESEKKQQEELIAKQAEEDKKKSDPTYALLMKMEQMMAMIGERHIPIAPGPLSRKKAEPIPDSEAEPVPVSKAKRVPRRKVEIEAEPDAEGTEEKPKRKPRVQKQIVDKPNPSKGLPKPRKKVVYLQQDPVQEESTQFVGYDIAPPAEPVQYQPSQGLLSAMMGRRNMNSFYQ
jgi:hypothetical protein